MASSEFVAAGKVSVDVEAFVAAVRQHAFIDAPGLLEDSGCKVCGLVEGFYTNGENFFTRNSRYEDEEL